MQVVGTVATAAGAVIVLLGLVIGVRSIPDIRRYMRIRHM